MSLDDIFLLLLSFASGGLVIFGGYWESKDKRRRFYRLSPRQIVFTGGMLTIIVSILNTLKTNSDSKKLESSLASNILLTHRIDSATVENNKLVKLVADLAQLNYGLSDKIEKQSEKNLFKADTLLHKAEALAVKTQSIIDNSTGGTSVCYVDVIPNSEAESGLIHLVNVGKYPIRNLRILPSLVGSDIDFGRTGGIIEVIKVSVLLPNGPLKTFEYEFEDVKGYKIIDPDMRGINFKRVKISREKINDINYGFLTDYNFWY